MTTHRQAVTDDLRQWIVTQADSGCRPEDVLAAMRRSGWDEDVAIEALEATLQTHLAARGITLPPALTVPDASLDDAPTELVADGHPVRVLMALKHPRIIVFGGLLTDDECEALKASARERLVRSETVDNATGGSEVHDARTSEGMFFERGETPLVMRIERRIAALLNWPVEYGEGLQVLRYGPGAQYQPHHDYFEPQHPGSAPILKRGGQRVGTLLMYLHTSERGGATTFPDIGLDVAPIKGHAVFFSYDRPHESTLTLHGGAPVTAGEKWVATKWLRESTFV